MDVISKTELDGAKSSEQLSKEKELFDKADVISKTELDGAKSSEQLSKEKELFDKADVISKTELDGAKSSEQLSKEKELFDKAKYMDILSDWHCFLCNKCFDKPVRISTCRHSFCYSCILWVRSCPKCGTSFTRKDIRRCIMLSHFVSFVETVNTALDLQSTENNSNKSNMEMEIVNKSSVMEKNTSRESTPMNKKLPTQKNLYDSFNSTRKSNDKCLELEDTGNLPKVHRKQNKSSGSRLKRSMKRSQIPSKVSPVRTPISRRKLEKKQKGTPRNRSTENKIKTSEIEKKNATGETPLHSACIKKDLNTVISLLDKGANPNVKDFAGWTPLIEAICKGNLPLVKTLLKYGAWPNVPAVANTTPLLEAVLQKNYEMIELLLQHGADINLRSSFNNTPLSLAEEDENLHRFLLNYDPEAVKVHTFLSPPFDPEMIPAVCSDVVKSEENNIFEICKALDFEVRSNFWPNASHIVTTTDDHLNCECSLNVLKGILNSVNIVSISWLQECQKSKSVVPTDSYEVTGTYNYPNTGVPRISRLNAFKMYPKLFDGCHISITGQWLDYSAIEFSKQDIIALIQASGAVYLLRDPDPEEIPENEKTVMFHSKKGSSLELVSHIILYQPNSDPKKEPMLKYNMEHVKTLPTTWFLKCIQTFSLCDP